MKVYIRTENQASCVPFGECEITEVGEIIASIKRAGGVYLGELGETSTDISFQYCLDDEEGYAEIIVGVP